MRTFLSDNHDADPQVKMRAGLNLPHLAKEDPLHRLLAPVYGAASTSLTREEREMRFALWPAQFHCLTQVQIFQSASIAQQQGILHAIHVALLQEAYFIEKLGMAFGAKMLLLSESTEERLLYSSLIADESQHLTSVGQFLESSEKQNSQNPFHRLLAEIIDYSDRPTLLFVIQVLLEGWGLTHYKSLSSHCVHPHLQTIFNEILIDEARHHGSGRVLLKQQQLEAQSIEHCKLALFELFQMVRQGPQMIVQAIENELGELTPSDKRIVFEELNSFTQTQQKLDTLKNLVAVEETHQLLRWCEENHLFQPLPAKDCV